MGWPNLFEPAPPLSNAFIDDYDLDDGGRYRYGFINAIGPDEVCELWDYSEGPLYAPRPDYSEKCRPEPAEVYPNLIAIDITFRATKVYDSVDAIGTDQYSLYGNLWNQWGAPMDRNAAIRLVRDVVENDDIDAAELFANWRTVEVNPDLKRQGYIYILEGIDTGTFKIGRTCELDKRLSAFGVQLPFEVHLIHSFKTVDMFARETELHKRFATKRVRGEWHKLSPDDIEYLMSLTDEV